MAKELSGSTTKKVEEQVKKERNIMFVAAMIVCGAVTVCWCGYSLYSSYTDHASAMAFDERYGELEREYAALQAEAEQLRIEQEEAAKADNPYTIDEESGIRTEYRDMYSAWEAGNEVAYLQNEYYKKKEMLQADRQRLNELVRSTDLWIGSSWDPSKTPLRWDFVTFYDATDKTYDVCWECWHEAPSGTMYLIAVKFASYDGETGTFRMLEGTYQTDFARMLNKKGAVEAGDPVTMSSSPAQQMYGELTGSTGSAGQGGQEAPDAPDGQDGQGGTEGDNGAGSAAGEGELAGGAEGGV